MTQSFHIGVRQCDLLGAVKARVAQALSCDNMADPVKTVAAIVLAVLSVGAVGAAHFAPIARKRNTGITVIFRPSSVSQTLSQCGKRHYSSYWLKELLGWIKEPQPGATYLSPIQPGLQWEHLPWMGSQWWPSLHVGHTSWQFSPKKPLEQSWSQRVPFQPRSQVMQRPSVTLQGCWPLQCPHLWSQ